MLLNGVVFVDIGDAGHAFFNGAIATRHKAAERFDGALEVRRFIIGHGHDVVEGFIDNAWINHDRTVNEGFELGAHGVEVDRRPEDNHIGLKHLFNHATRTILLGAETRLAGVARTAGGDLLACEGELFHKVPRFTSACYEVIAKGFGVGTLTRATGDNENFLTHNKIFRCERLMGECGGGGEELAEASLGFFANGQFAEEDGGLGRAMEVTSDRGDELEAVGNAQEGEASLGVIG